MTSRQQSILYCLLRSTLSKCQTVQVVKQVLFYERVHGIGFVINRFTLLSLELLGDPSPAIKHRGGLWVGPFRPLHRKALQSDRLLARVLNIFKFTSLFKETVTEQHYKAHQDNLSSALVRPTRALQLTQAGPRPFFYGTYRGTYRDWAELDSCATIVFSNYEAFKGLPIKPRVAYLTKSHMDYVGRVSGLVKDGGHKIRFVYAPWTPLQFSLRPLYYRLKEYARGIPQLFHENQEAGVEQVRQLMIEEHMVSLDLKWASDLIPADPQFQMLVELFPDYTTLIALARSVSYGKWVTPYGGFVQHSVGQPMGTCFSFLAFSVYLYKILIEALPRGNFVIVGDDLVIPLSHFHYLEDLGFQISPSKSVVTGDYNQLCGHLITRDRAYPVRRFKRVTDPLSTVARFGKSVIPLFPKRYRELIRLLSYLPEPVGLGLREKAIQTLPRSAVADLYGSVPYTTIPEVGIANVQRRLDTPHVFYSTRTPPSPPEVRRFKKYLNLVKPDVERSSFLCSVQHVNRAEGETVGDLQKQVYGFSGRETPSPVNLPKDSPYNPPKPSTFFVKLSSIGKVIGKPIANRPPTKKLVSVSSRKETGGATGFTVLTILSILMLLATWGAIAEADPRGCCYLLVSMTMAFIAWLLKPNDTTDS